MTIPEQIAKTRLPELAARKVNVSHFQESDQAMMSRTLEYLDGIRSRDDGDQGEVDG